MDIGDDLARVAAVAPKGQPRQEGRTARASGSEGLASLVWPEGREGRDREV